jgi:arylformamidase
MKVYDISQTIREGMAVWPGDRKFRIQWTMRSGKGDSCNVSAVTMSVHTGTHLDAPYHFADSGEDVASLPLERYIGSARVIELKTGGTITPEHLGAFDWDGVERVLFKTASSRVPEDRFDRNFVYLSDEGASFLGERKLLLVGTDAPSVDAFESKSLSAHKTLFQHGIAILEGVRLFHVAPGDYELICLPLRFVGLDGSPVRAILRQA